MSFQFARKLWNNRQFRLFFKLFTMLLFVFLALIFAQTVIAHGEKYFTPDYPRQDLSQLLSQSSLSDEDYQMLFLQAGLGRSAIDSLLSEGQTGVDEIDSIQDQFFNPPKVECQPLLGWFTREDHLVNDSGEIVYGPDLVDLEPGDVVLTLSTHTFGWRHGHAGLVVDNAGTGTTLECVVLGTNSTLVDASHWRAYSNYAVLRIKDVTPDQQKAVVSYAEDHLLNVPYHLTAGLIGLKKAPETDTWSFGLQCSYLVWYAWNEMGYDLDSDGGRLVTTSDIMHSKYLQVVQIYGLDPRNFTN
jgi:uncharacterized protein YycO